MQQHQGYKTHAESPVKVYITANEFFVSKVVCYELHNDGFVSLPDLRDFSIRCGVREMCHDQRYNCPFLRRGDTFKQ